MFWLAWLLLLLVVNFERCACFPKKAADFTNELLDWTEREKTEYREREKQSLKREAVGESDRKFAELHKAVEDLLDRQVFEWVDLLEKRKEKNVKTKETEYNCK